MILSKAEYLASIGLLLPDNSTQEISPLDLRTSLVDLVDSVTNFIDGNIAADNFSTPDTRNTRAGLLSLNSLTLAGRSSVDNSAYGYASLRNNYNGVENTAVGSYALSCNLYGGNNTAVGYHALAGNITGSGNVGIGNFSLNNGKDGDFNIAIGHGAGYYLGQNDNHKLYIGSHAINSGNLCGPNDTPHSSGESPLIFGDLNPASHRLGIGMNTLHNYGMLQVSGDISPSLSGSFHVGRSQYPFSSINEEVHFSGGVVGIGGQPSGLAQGVTDGKLTVYGDLVPSENGRYALGYQGGVNGVNRLLWDGYFNDVIISGQAFINDATYNNISECLYECKTLHLATSGFCDPDGLGFHDSAVCGFLNDEGLDGAGFEIHSSGASYRRDYKLVYRFPDPVITCLEVDSPHSRSRFSSNISLHIESGSHLQTDRVISNNSRTRMSFVYQSGCMGYFIEPFEMSGQRTYFAQEPHVDEQHPVLGDVNFLSRSGTDIQYGNPSGYNHTVMHGNVDSGVDITHRFSSRIRSANLSRGFRIVYHDEMDKWITATGVVPEGGGPG